MDSSMRELLNRSSREEEIGPFLPRNVTQRRRRVTTDSGLGRQTDQFNFHREQESSGAIPAYLGEEEMDTPSRRTPSRMRTNSRQASGGAVPSTEALDQQILATNRRLAQLARQLSGISSEPQTPAEVSRPEELKRTREESHRNPLFTQKPLVTPATFDGSSPWMDYHTHFDACAEINGWTDAQRGLYLAISLRGPAQAILGYVSGGTKASYHILVNALRQRFAPPNMEELYKSEQRGRRRKPEESLLELGQAIRRLVTLGYPNTPGEVLDTLAKDQFIEALTEPEMRLRLQRTRPKNFDETLQLAVELDACQRAEERRSGKPQRVRAIESNPENDEKALRDKIAEIVRDVLAQNQDGQQKEVRNTDRRPRKQSSIRCYHCGENGHMQRKCPHKESTENRDPESKPQKKALPILKEVKLGGGSLASVDKGFAVRITVNGVMADFVVDTGAAVTIVSNDLLEKISPTDRQNLKHMSKTLILADGTPMETKGFGCFVLDFAGHKTNHEAVVASINGQGILGLDFLRENKCMLDLENGSMKLGRKWVNLVEDDSNACRRISLKENILIPARHEVVINCLLQQPSEDMMYGIVEPTKKLSSVGEILVARSLVSPLPDHTVPLRLLNLGDEPLQLYKGTTAAHLEPIRAVVPLSQNWFQQESREPQSAVNDLAQRFKGNLTPKENAQAEDLLRRYRDVFACTDEALGRTDVVKHTINTGDARPLKQQPRRVSPVVRAEINKQVDGMLERGIIEPSNSPWASPVILVRKKDGSLRFCVDYRKLNQVTVKDAYPLPRVDDSLDALAGSVLFSTMDLRSGYWQVEMSSADKKKTAFTTHRGLYEFNVMPFGLCNAPSTFERLMETVCAGLRWETCLIYLMFILVFGRNFGEHLTRLECVLQRLLRAGLRLKPNKCALFAREVTFLGYVVNQDGIGPCPDKVAAVRDWPRPTSATEVRSFLGLASYYRKFIESFGSIAVPLHRLTEKHRIFVWTADCEEAFGKLKAALVTAPVLAHPNFGETFVLDTDACNSGIGGVLSQHIDGVERVVAYGSRTLTKSERHYCVTRKELLAVVHFVKHFKPYLYGKRFQLRTDQSALRWAMQFKEPEGQLARWLNVLTTYDFQILHRAGRLHGNADGLSRAPCRQCKNETCGYQSQKEDPMHVKSITLDGSPSDTQKAQNDDSCLQPVIQWLQSGKRPDWDCVSSLKPEVKSYWAQWERLYLKDGILCRKWFEESGRHSRDQLIVPLSLRAKVLEMNHNSSTGGHLGVAKTVSKIRHNFHWFGLHRDVRKWCESCATCAQKKPYGKRARAPMQITSSGAPMERIAMDLMGPLPKTVNGNMYNLVIQDYFSKWVEAHALPNMEAETVARVLVDEIICRFGVPRIIHTDQGSQFESRLMTQLCDLLDIHKTRTTPYHPQSGGMVERMNRTLQQMLSSYVSTNQKDWDLHLQLVCMAYRAAEHEATKFSPNYIFLEREVTLPAELETGLSPGKTALTHKDYADRLCENLQTVHELARKHIGLALHKQKRRYDTKLKWQRFQVGDRVWLFTPQRRKGLSSKLQKWWTGPHTIVSKYSDVTYRVQIGKKAKVVHVDRLKPYSQDTKVCEANKNSRRPEVIYQHPQVILEPTIEIHRRDPPSAEDEVITSGKSRDRARRRPGYLEDFCVYHVTGESIKDDAHSLPARRTGNLLSRSAEMVRVKSVVRNPVAMPKCPLCPEVFNSPEELVEHITAKHSRQKHSCMQCSYTSERLSDVRRHVERRHPSRSPKRGGKSTETTTEAPLRKPTRPSPVLTPKRTANPGDSSHGTPVLLEDRASPIPDAARQPIPVGRVQLAPVSCTVGRVRHMSTQTRPEMSDKSTQCNGIKRKHTKTEEWEEYE